jgi:hypothetical protein
MPLNISSQVSLPNDAVTQTFACIGRKGAGKTYLASMLAEQMLDLGAQVVILDPVGNWYGLRVAADGKGKGKAIFIAGGERGDVPILPESGARFARLVVEKHISMVLDVSGFRQGERKRFAADFAEEFFHLKKTQRSAVHLFVEEAQLFVPQRCGPDEARMLGAYENIIRLGRNYGIGATLISQRPQSVNKEVLSQVECLCVLQVNGSHERKALEEWVQEAGADRKLVGELPGLGRGEGYVWSPSWLHVFQRVKFAKKVTFDASATPEVGKSAKAALLSAVDVEALKADLQEVIISAEKDDPKALRKQIVELQKQVAAKTSPSVVVPTGPTAEQLEACLKADLGYLQNETRKRMESALNRVFISFLEDIKHVGEILANEKSWSTVESLSGKTMSVLRGDQAKSDHAPSQPKPRPSAPQGNGSIISLKGPERRILNAIAWLESIGVESPEQPAVAFLAGYTYGGGAYNNPRGRLNQTGLVEYMPNERIRLTDDGKRVAVYPESIGSNEELHQAVLGRLKGPEQRLLRPLLKSYPSAMHNQTLADAAGYTAGAGAFNNPRGRLKTLGLIEYPQPGMVRAKDLLFPESR